MPPREATLKLLKGGAPADGPTRRRTVTRRTPTPVDPVTEALERLDEEPAVPEPPRPRRSTVERARRRTATGPARTRRKPPVPAARSGRRTTTAALVGVLCVALALAGWSASRWYGDRTLADARQRALAAARQTTVDFVSISAGSVDRDLQRIAAGSTGDFHDEFTRGQAQVRAAVVANNVESRGTVLRAAVLSGGRRSAVVLIAMDATVHNTNSPDGRVSHYRIQVTVARGAGGRWLVSQLQFVG